MSCLNHAGYMAWVATGGIGLDVKVFVAPYSELELVVCLGYWEAALGAVHNAMLHEAAERELFEGGTGHPHLHMLIQCDPPQIGTKGGHLDQIAEFPIVMAERLVAEEMAPVVCLVAIKGGFPKCLDCKLEIISVF